MGVYARVCYRHRHLGCVFDGFFVWSLLALLWLLGSLLCSLLCTWCLPRWLVNYGSFVALEMGVDTTSRNRGNVRGDVRAHIRTWSMLQFARGWFRGRKQLSLLNSCSLSLGTYIVVLHFGKQTRHKCTGKLLMTTIKLLMRASSS